VRPGRNWGLEKAEGIKSLFASFSSEKEESSFFKKKEAKKLLVSAVLVRLLCGEAPP
jgi:hypothetical protein